MNNENSEQLFVQIRTAHRLLAAYYQRLLPCIEQVAKTLELDFYLWQPKDFARPGQRTSDPFNRWCWDMLPALSTYYVFSRFKDSNRIQVGEYLVDFLVNSDTGVINKGAAEPDALALSTPVENAQSTLTVNVYAPYQSINANWAYNLWDGCDFAHISEQPNPQKDKYKPLVSNGFSIPLTTLLSEDGVTHLAKKIQNYIDVTVEKAKSLAENEPQ